MRWPLQTECNKFYGDPRLNPRAWERENLVIVTPPFKMFYAGQPIKGVRIHKKCADSLKRVFDRIWKASGESQGVIDLWGVSNFSGSHVFRTKRGGATSLSMHAYGCAIDLDAPRNGFRDPTPNLANYPEVIAAFEAEGWEWGGRWSGRSRDGMHFQAAHTSASVAEKQRGGYGGATPHPITDRISAAQRRLLELRYPPGKIDGLMGPLTRSAIRDFQDAMDMTVTGVLDDETFRVLMGPEAKERPVSASRAALTVEDLKASGSRTIKNAEAAKTNLQGLAASVAGLGAVASQVNDVSGNLQSLFSAVENGGNVVAWAKDHWQMLVIFTLVALAVWFSRRAWLGLLGIEAARLEDARTGVNVAR